MRALVNIALSEKTYGYLLGALLLSIPLPFAFSSISLIAFFAVSLFSAFYHKKSMHLGYWIPMALFLCMILSLTWTEHWEKSIRGLERQLPFLLIPLAFWLMPKVTRSVLNFALFVFSVGLSFLGLGLMLKALISCINGAGTEVFFYHSLVSIFDLNAIYISVMVSLSLLFMIFYKRRTLWNVSISLVLLLFLVLLSSKNLIIITILSIIVGFLISRKFNFKRWSVLIFIGLTVFTLLFYSPLKSRWVTEFNTDIKDALTCEGFNENYPWTGASFRLFQARIFYESFNENKVWFTGFGINAAQARIAEKQNEYYLYCGYNTYNYHNQYVQTFAELGVFGFIVLLLLFVILFRSYLRHKELMILFFIIVMASAFFTETYIWRQRGMIHFLTLYCLFIHLFSGKKPLSKSP